MPHTLEPNGWGLGPWGIMSWAVPSTSLGGPLPTQDPFEIYCVSESDMLGLLTHPEVVYIGGATQHFLDIATEMFVLASGGLYPTGLARLEYNTLVPQTFTFEGVFYFDNLPSNFANLQERHCFIGVTDAQGSSAGLFVSEIGLLYTGAVHYSGDDVVLDSPLQALPNSQVLVTQGEFYTLRLAVSYDNSTTYVYWTKTSDIAIIGHQLRYILPAIASADAIVLPPDRTTLSVRGTLSDPTILGIHTTCLSTGLQIPNLAPRSDAGLDQAVRVCSVVRLDGTRSFDPEGSILLYAWRMLDAPTGSQYIFDGFDAVTLPLLIPTGFTNIVYSDELAAENALDPITAGDVLIIAGDPYNILSTGIDFNGFFVVVEGFVVPDSFAGVAFKLVRQRGISGPLTAKPTFLPDLPGLYKFDLIVFDGALYSDAAVTIINVTESPIPRGLVPDCRFLWGYLSDFWKLVEDKERIEIFWSAFAQVAASELLNLWQLEYSKSLRDIQRTFQRRWLRYDMLMEEDPIRIEDTTIRAVFGGITSSAMSAGGIASGSLNLRVGDASYSILVQVAAGTKLVVAEALAVILRQQLLLIDRRFSITVIPNVVTLDAYVRIDAPFVFSVENTSSITVFPFVANTYPQGFGGATGERSYYVDKSLTGLPIVSGDFLVLEDIAYRIAGVVTNAADSFAGQRITTIDPLPFTASTSWAISGQATSKTLDFWFGLVCTGDIVLLDVVNFVTNTVTTVEVTALGASPAVNKILGIDASSVGAFLLDTTTYRVFLRGVLRRKYVPIDSLVTDVPYLREKINNADDSEVLRRNVDYFLERFRNAPCIRFIVGTPDVWQGVNPPKRLWAETTYLDNRPMIEANFGIPAGFTLDDFTKIATNLDYLSAVRGLWFSYFNGPTLFNLRAGVQILLGLPFAEEKGIIEEIRTDFSLTTGRILVRDAKNTEVVRSYSFPASLDLEVSPVTGVIYAVGDTVEQFAPLVEGTEVIDYVKDPKWIEGYVNQGTKFEVEKFFQFLVRVDSAAFNLSALLFAQTFIRRIKPTYTLPIFIVRSTVGDSEVSTSDLHTDKGYLTLHAHATAAILTGEARMWDQPHPGGGGYWGPYDEASPWNFSEYDLSPAEALFTRLTTIWPGGIPIADSIFYTDTPLFTLKIADFSAGPLVEIPVVPVQLDISKVSTVTDTINKISVQFQGVGDGALLTLVVKKNAVTAATLTFTVPFVGGNPDAGTWRFNFSAGFSVVPGDVLSVELSHPTGFNTYVGALGVILGVGTDWQNNVALPAGTYHTYLVL